MYTYYEFTWNYKAIISLDNYILYSKVRPVSVFHVKNSIFMRIFRGIYQEVSTSALSQNFSAPQLNSSVIRIDLKTIATYFWGAGHVCMKSIYTFRVSSPHIVCKYYRFCQVQLGDKASKN